MIISHSKQFCFFRVPRTSSTASEILLRMCVQWDAGDILATVRNPRLPEQNLPAYINHPDYIYGAHLTPTQAVAEGMITEQQLNDYDCYSMLRDPFKRHLSAFYTAIAAPVDPSDYKRVIKDFGNDEYGILNAPQENWFKHNNVQVVTPLDQADFQAEMTALITTLGGFVPSAFPEFNRSRAKPEGIPDSAYFDDPAANGVLKTALAGDIAFYNQIFPGRLTGY